LHPDTTAGVSHNIGIAKVVCEEVCKAGCSPFAPHVFYTQFLDDDIAEERVAGIECGSAWLDAADLVLVLVGDGVSTGMRAEMDMAERLGKKIVKVERIDEVQAALLNTDAAFKRRPVS
jgi:hypothetical protein